MNYRANWSALILTVAALALPVPARATTFIGDNLEGPCCAPTTVNLPTFPTLTLENKYICWNNCNVGLSGNTLTTFEPLPTPACGIYRNLMTVTNLSGVITAWTGNLIMTYSRTWAEASIPGDPPDVQVWRFILNGDLIPSSTLIGSFGSNACVVAPCTGTYNRFHVQGYIDYALDCAGNWSIAFAVDHDCDAFEHDNTLTCRPGSFHPTRSYTWVGPAAGFVCDTTVPTATGTTSEDAFRNFDFTMPLPMICQFEQPVDSGTIDNAGDYCPCSTTGGQYKIQRFDARTMCQSSAFSTTFGPWEGLVGKSIGFWTDPGVYPGTESVHIERVHTEYNDPCSTTFMTRPYFIGVQTQGGFDTHKLTGTVPTPVSNRLIDLGSATFPSTSSAPRIGKFSVSDKMIHLNVD